MLCISVEDSYLLQRNASTLNRRNELIHDDLRLI